MVDSILSAGLQGAQSGIATARRAAEDIASAAAPITPPVTSSDNTESADTTADITEAIVELKVGEQQVKASAAVIKTADEVLGTLVDTTA